MFREIPVSNKLCFGKDLKRSWKIHEEKMRNLKSTLSSDSPKKFGFLDPMKKKSALKEIKNIKIDRQNQILHKKIKCIEAKGLKNSYLQFTCYIAPRTLHQSFRKSQLARIVHENQGMLKRITGKKSVYNFKKMEKQRIQIEKNISLISQFPYKNYPQTSTKTNLYMTQNMAPFSDQKKVVQIETYIYNGTIQQEGKYYVVTTNKQKGQFYIEVQNLSNSFEKYRIKLNEKEIKLLLSTYFNNKLEQLIKNLKVCNGTCYIKYQMNQIQDNYDRKDQIQKKNK